MSMRIYRVTVGRPGEEPRTLQVPSKTDIQAGDAAVAAMSEGDYILGIEEVDDPYQQTDAMPAGTQSHPDQIT
ncbi:hypothetical protein Q0812_08405 [Brevundimonas sp. 2R-24]|uniref:Uncharacterized protein n=1 Tax=Peiella sedimenti TaxID=3061083 RepID=A0ABT8SQ36_9CAUL|nr:hypothetical protein [Caulobacteraceae bacterium XZ-24]